MPFTPAHAAIVLPLLKSRYFSATALVIGCMAPDFEYFFKMSVSGVHGHTFLGIFYFDAPVTLLLAFLFHGYIRNNLIDNLPVFLQRRLHLLRQFDFVLYLRANWIVFLCSAALGAVLHIFWDAFTHFNGFFVQHISVLQNTILPFNGARYPLHYVLQHLSTYVGLSIIAMYVLLIKPDGNIHVKKPRLFYWIVIAFISAFVLFLRFNWLPETLNLGNVVVSAITGICIAMIIAGKLRFENGTIQA
jgi:Domain of unknown function (DUF4184)